MKDLYLIAQIADRGVAIDGGLVDSVVDIDAIVAVPHAPVAVRGLAALRSRVVTVIDTRVALGLPPSAIVHRAVVAKIDGHHYAFLVDALQDVAPLDRRPLPGGHGGEDGWSRGGTAMVEHEGEPLLVLDIAALIPVAVADAA
ncbi:chemotaxis protein CheW [Sphingomonas rubra]|uniref:Purine-binding chemotaxis protein CheW n=1 Tax=Sphingomonas rubra TaxID=634430 RepID=A0A1I5SWQ2_9SPHN|nr:chemotaxis protein CheW [Sphingomonas rubra]SFP75163.1 purine-binding chemotaxis protein CheW [Sphingomonas rubra]